MSLQFQYKEFTWLFLAIALLVILFLALLQWKGKVSGRIGDRTLVKALTSNFSSPLFTLKFIIFLIAFSLGVTAAMNPRQPGEAGAVNRKGIDIAVALDVSNSMLATDMAPNRLERAKQFIARLLTAMPNDRVALVLFAGKAYLQMPFTADHGAARLFVSTAGPDAVPQQGTVISDALTMSANAFTGAEDKFKTVVLISDGEDHDEDAVSTAKKLAGQGVMVNTIGIGSPEGSPIIDPATGEPKKDGSGNPVISRLNEETLQEIAKETKGIYLRLQNSEETVGVLVNQFSAIDPKIFTDISQVNFRTYYAWLIAAMFILLLAENFIPEKVSARSAAKKAIA